MHQDSRVEQIEKDFSLTQMWKPLREVLSGFQTPPPPNFPPKEALVEDIRAFLNDPINAPFLAQVIYINLRKYNRTS
jgi:hypothetical protein